MELGTAQLPRFSGKNVRIILFWGDKLYFSALTYTSTTIYFSSQSSLALSLILESRLNAMPPNTNTGQFSQNTE